MEDVSTSGRRSTSGGSKPAEADVAADREVNANRAATLLGVSRSFLVAAMDEGKLPYRKVGARRRVRLAALMDYKRAMERDRARALDELSALDQELGLGYE